MYDPQRFKNLYENAAEGTKSTRLAPRSCFETDLGNDKSNFSLILFYLQHMPANYKGRLMLYPYDHTGGTPVAGGSVGGGVVLWNPKMPIGKTVTGKVWTDLAVLGGVPLPAKGKDKFSGHMGRKTTASRSGALSGIISATGQMEATGHKSESAFAVYNHTSVEDDIARSAGIEGGRDRAAGEAAAARSAFAGPVGALVVVFLLAGAHANRLRLYDAAHADADDDEDDGLAQRRAKIVITKKENRVR